MNSAWFRTATPPPMNVITLICSVKASIIHSFIQKSIVRIAHQFHLLGVYTVYNFQKQIQEHLKLILEKAPDV